MQTTAHVHRLPVTTPTLFPATTTNVFVVTDGREAVLIDAGYDHEDAHATVTAYLKSIGSPQVKAILITHFHRDHTPGAKFFSAHFNCPIYAHPIEVPYVEEEIAPVKVTGTLEEGDVMAVGDLQLHVFHAPGHTHGCLNFWLPEDEVLFVGDNIVSVGTTWIGPPEGDLKAYLTSLERLKSYNAKWIGPGHGEMIADVTEKIDFFINRRLERENQIVGLLAKGSLSAQELLEQVYGDTVHPSVIWVAERTIQGHLNKLVDEGRAVELPEKPAPRYQLVQA
ncbi:MAG TPA: MBL fold metallo-hydrolase [Bacilli bacterium]|nr:MBL fold metallo-hydrolase [Bacilli bacterium]